MKKLAIRTCVIALLVGAACYSNAQKTEISVDTVEITERRDRIFDAGIHVTKVDSNALKAFSNTSIAEILGRYSNVYVKSNGSGSLATISFRGTGSEHTAIMWNGFPINSPNLGLLDMALLPAFFLDDAEVRHGPASSLYGTSAIGGSILLDSDAGQGNEVGINMNGGSFNDAAIGLRLKNSRGKLSHKTRVWHHVARNNFPFNNSTKIGTPREYLQHASLSQTSLMENVRLQLSEKHSIRGAAWYQFSEREIPPTMTQANNTAVQTDSAFRAFLEWKTNLKAGHFVARSGWMQEIIRYRDPAFSLDDGSDVRTLMTELEFRRLIASRFILNAGLMYTGAFAYIDGYGRDVNESRGAAFAAINLPVGLSTMISAALRQDMIAGKYAPLIPSFGIQSWLPGEALQLKANLARSFNYPTMNMRYWVPGGNPDLLPERGVAGDVGVVAAFEWTGGDFRAEATTFLSQVEDWLQWAPTDSGFWAPQNLKSVRSGGVEFSGRANQSLGDFQFSLGARYSFTKSTNVKIEAGGDSTILNKQLMYVPQQVGNVDLVASYKRIRLTLRGTYTGIRYTTQDHLGSVPSYFLMEADADYFFSRERVDFRLGIRLSNLLNSDYQNVEFRPMPGRALMIRLDMNIKTKRY